MVVIRCSDPAMLSRFDVLVRVVAVADDLVRIGQI
jgi:hypothetical protein